MIDKKGIDLIKRFESFRETPYLCPAGYLTIGYGHAILPEEKMQYLGESEGEALLLRDVAKAERSVLRLILIPLEDHQYDALVSFTFNCGGGALQRSTLRQKINREEHALVPSELRKWIWAGGRKSKGLIARIESEAILYESG